MHYLTFVPNHSALSHEQCIYEWVSFVLHPQVIITNSNIWRSRVNWTIKSFCVQKIYYKKSFRVFFDFTDQDQAQKGFWFSQFPFWGRKIVQFLKRVEYYMQLVLFASRWLIHIKKQLRQMSCDWETCRINLWSVLFFFFLIPPSFQIRP